MAIIDRLSFTENHSNVFVFSFDEDVKQVSHFRTIMNKHAPSSLTKL